MSLNTTIGLSNVVFAICTKDDITGVTYGTITPLADAMNAKLSFKTDSQPIYSDDQASEIINTASTAELEFQQKSISLDNLAALLGHTQSGGIMKRAMTDVSPYVAIGFKTMKSNRTSFEYHWLLKGKFVEPDREFETLADKASPKYLKIKGTFLPRIFDGVTSRMADTDSANYVSSIAANWFAAVEQPADTTSPVISGTTPAANATSVSRTSAFVWTFSKSLLPSTVTTDNFYLVSTADGTKVDGTVAYNDTAKTATFTPTVQLAATTKYLAVADADVSDLSGNRLVQVNSLFTTGS